MPKKTSSRKTAISRASAQENNSLQFFLYTSKLGISNLKHWMNSWPKIWCNSLIDKHSLNMFLWRAQFFSNEDLRR